MLVRYAVRRMSSRNYALAVVAVSCGLLLAASSAAAQNTPWVCQQYGTGDLCLRYINAHTGVDIKFEMRSGELTRARFGYVDVGTGVVHYDDGAFSQKPPSRASKPPTRRSYAWNGTNPGLRVTGFLETEGRRYDVSVDAERDGLLPAPAAPVFIPGATPPWAACGSGADTGKLVREFRHGAFQDLAAGVAYLRCGTQGWGYRHLVRRHGEEWRRLASYTRSNWRDLADWAIANVLSEPDYAQPTEGRGGDRFTLRARVTLTRGRRAYRTYRPFVVLGVTDKNLVTAYPGQPLDGPGR